MKGVEAAGQHMRGRGADAQRVTIGGRANRAADTETAGSSANVLDDHGLTENAVYLLGQKPRQGIGGTSGRKRHDHGDRMRRIALRGGHARRCQANEGRGHNRQQFTHGFLRDAAPQDNVTW